MSPYGFPGVSKSAPFGRDPIDGSALIAPPIVTTESVKNIVSSDSDDNYRLRDIIVELLQQKQPGMTKSQAEAFIEQSKFKKANSP